MDALDHLFDDLQSARPDLPWTKDLIDEDRCLEVRIGQVTFLLSFLREWCAGIVVHARLGQPADQGLLMREALRLNTGNAARHEPIYALQDDELVCRYRLPITDAHAGTLIERLQHVANQQQEWLDAGWLRVNDEEACA